MVWGRGFILLVICTLSLIGCGGNPSGPDGSPRETVLYDREPDWSRDGSKIVYLSKGDPENHIYGGLFVVGVATRQRRMILSDDTELHGPRWSPDGNWVVFSRYGNIYKVWHRGGVPEQLTSGGSDFHPSWSADGNFIVFGRTGGSSPGIYRMNSAGGARSLVYADAKSPDWFPDGRYLALLTTDTANQIQVARLNLDDSSLEFLTADQIADKEHLRVSPDGTRVMYARREGSKAPRLFIVEVHTQRVQELPGNGGFTGTWSPDGNYIAHDDPFDGAIYIRNLLENTELQISPGVKSKDPVWDSLYIEQDDYPGGP
jgi:Tol biopolymer transport system component